MSDLELPDDEAFAAEHALGVLTARERADAEARMVRDPAFAADVEAWRNRLAPLFAAIPAVEPPESLWRAIERALPANDNAAEKVRFWKRASAGGFGLAAASLAAVVFLAAQPPEVVTRVVEAPIRAQMLNARLATDGGQPLFVAAYDPERKSLLVASLVPPGADPTHVHQLWLIPADGKPRSLGFVEPGASKAMPMGPAMAAMATEGAALAVSVEEPGGSRQPGPTGPVAAVGKLAKI